jgi:hypothetical protein
MQRNRKNAKGMNTLYCMYIISELYLWNEVQYKFFCERVMSDNNIGQPIYRSASVTSASQVGHYYICLPGWSLLNLPQSLVHHYYICLTVVKNKSPDV